MPPLLPEQVLGFPRYARDSGEGIIPDAPQEGPTAPAGVIASVPTGRQGFLPIHNHHHHSRHFVVHHPRSRPPACAHHGYRTTLAVSLELPTRGLERERRQRPRERALLDRWEGTTSIARAKPTGRGDEDLPGPTARPGPCGPG